MNWSARQTTIAHVRPGLAKLVRELFAPCLAGAAALAVTSVTQGRGLFTNLLGLDPIHLSTMMLRWSMATIEEGQWNRSNYLKP